MNRNLLDELTERISRLMPQAQAMGEEAKEGMRTALQQTFAGMDLVTREEFDAQQRALERAEQKLIELEAQLTALEQRAASPDRED
ncbi:MAG: accessory factor UbiK family protein [Pseudomonadota bacterium]|nr:accessory factor UbiK family protein [Pseudomonadota bacterium]